MLCKQKVVGSSSIVSTEKALVGALCPSDQPTNGLSSAQAGAGERKKPSIRSVPLSDVGVGPKRLARAVVPGLCGHA